MECGEKLAYGRRVAWWSRAERSPCEIAVGDARTWIGGARVVCGLEVRKSAPPGSSRAESDLAVRMAKIRAEARHCARSTAPRGRSWAGISRVVARTQDALAAVERAGLARLPERTRTPSVTLRTGSSPRSAKKCITWKAIVTSSVQS
jgi:hypothetical protein